MTGALASLRAALAAAFSALRSAGTVKSLWNQMKNMTTPIAAMIRRPVESTLQNGCTRHEEQQPDHHEIELLVQTAAARDGRPRPGPTATEVLSDDEQTHHRRDRRIRLLDGGHDQRDAEDVLDDLVHPERALHSLDRGHGPPG